MRTTLILDPDIKKQAQMKAVQEDKTLSEVVNDFLSLYVNDRVYPTNTIKAKSLKEALIKGEFGFENPVFDREAIYDKFN